MIKCSQFILMLLASFAVYNTAIGQSFHDPEAYRESKCYKEFAAVYAESVRQTMESLKLRRGLAFSTGIILNSTSSSDWGKSEKSIINAADMTPTYKKSAVKNPDAMNAFSYIHQKVIESFPGATPHETRSMIRKGFEEGDFCTKFLFFKFRASKKKVARLVVKGMKDALEVGSVPSEAVNDSELGKGEFLSGEDQKNLEKGSGRSASGI